jgi:predicted ATPase
MDLARCRGQLASSGTIKPFPFGEKDISIKYNIPQKLIGREKEVDILLSAFDRVSEGAERSQMMLVSGYPGIGKSALINEIHKPIVAKRGYFIAGKYDPFRRDVPYSAIIQAFQGLIKQILTESEEKINNWKDTILKAVGPNGRIITDVFPIVELIIGKQPDVPELGAEQSQNRFNLVFKSFVSIFADREHPLALFLDDLPWADPASKKNNTHNRAVITRPIGRLRRRSLPQGPAGFSLPIHWGP